MAKAKSDQSKSASAKPSRRPQRLPSSQVAWMKWRNQSSQNYKEEARTFGGWDITIFRTKGMGYTPIAVTGPLESRVTMAPRQENGLSKWYAKELDAKRAIAKMIIYANRMAKILRQEGGDDAERHADP